ncbi:hypothetical protein EDC01DRAFT_655925 [Geopyxis carbonaria]|nr:hypothetical protein EDC01DRAFT_655925 [Geopyxis carbonaria]
MFVHHLLLLLAAIAASVVAQVKPSPDNTCGSVQAGQGQNYSCTSASSGPCCSRFGNCGSTDAYCGTGCQRSFGTCGTTGTTPDPPTSASGNCGVQNGNARCASNACCSAQGVCGTANSFCRSPECQTDFGRCDADVTPRGASTANVPRPKIGSVPYGSIIRSCKSSPDPKRVALTFDDGPFSYTDELLDILASYGVKATFFVTGINLSKGAIDDPANPWAAMIRRAYAAGHQIASHTWSHADLSTLTAARQATEMVKLEMALRNVIGRIPTYMRPPYVSCDAQCLATLGRLGYHVVYYDLDTQDFKNNRPETNQVSKDIVRDYLVRTTVDDYVSIAHDIHEQTVRNLTVYMLDEMVRYGWKGVSFGECVDDPEANWYRDL